jgi:hypothetical protein
VAVAIGCRTLDRAKTSTIHIEQSETGSTMRLRLLVTLLGLPVLVFVAFLRVRSGVRWGKAALEVTFGMYALLVATTVSSARHRLGFSIGRHRRRDSKHARRVDRVCDVHRGGKSV